MTHANAAASETERLWASSDSAEWQRALDRYWVYVKPTHVALEQEMEALDPRMIAGLDADQWYDWLLTKYFVWKYTAPNRYATTTMHLKRQGQGSGRQYLLSVRDQIVNAGHYSIHGAS